VLGINDAGQIVGHYFDGTGCYATTCGHGFLDSAGVFTSIDFPGAFQTAATGINDAGQSAGTTFLQVQLEINFPGANSTIVTGINDAGQIDGSFNDDKTSIAGVAAGFLATPMECPSLRALRYGSVRLGDGFAKAPP
jgi:hypothetical protein